MTMAKAATISFKEFQMRYHTEETCREELFRQRFPEGFVCPTCGCKEFSVIRSRNLCQCRSCRHQTSVTAGTVMHRTHLPLTVWFWAIYLCVTDKRGISAVQLSRTLGIGYDSAWHLLARIRKGKETNITNFLALWRWMITLPAVPPITENVAGVWAKLRRQQQYPKRRTGFPCLCE